MQDPWGLPDLKDQRGAAEALAVEMVRQALPARQAHAELREVRDRQEPRAFRGPLAPPARVDR